MNGLKAFAAILPGLVVHSISSWLNLFVFTRLAYPNWAVEAQDVSLALGAFVAIAICLMDAEKQPREIISRTKALFTATVVALAFCWILYFILGRGVTNAYADLLQDVWFFVFIIGMALVVATIAEGSLSLRDERSILFWIIVAVSGVIFAAIAGYFLYRLLH